MQEIVSVGAIETTLRKMWHSQEATQKIKASLFNLIVYTHDPQREEYFKGLIQQIITHIPCRIFYIRGNSPLPLQATLSYQTSFQGQLLIGCEQIQLDIPEGKEEQIPFLIRSLLLPDLPINVIWGQDPAAQDLVDMHASISRLIIDADCTKELGAFSKEILRYLDKGHFELIDMRWTHLIGWRQVLANVFNSQEHLEALSKIVEVTITYRAGTWHNRIETLYLQAWLACQLGWPTPKLKEKQGHLHFDYGQVTVNLIPLESDLNEPGPISSLTLIAQNDRGFHFQQLPGTAQVICHLTTKDRCELPLTFPLTGLRRGLGFMRQLFYSQTSPHYVKMIAQLAKTPWK